MTYIDNVALDVSTFDSFDIRVKGPNGLNLLANYLGMAKSAETLAWVVTYSIPAPGGMWDDIDIGDYEVSMEANQVTDTSSNPVPSGVLGTFGYQTSTPDLVAPSGPAVTPDVTNSGGATYDFTVIYLDDRAVQVSTLGNTDIRVRGPNGYDQPAAFLGVQPDTDGSLLLASYRIVPPGGSWDAADFGAYTLSMMANQVADTSARHVAAGELGGFRVFVGGPVVDLNGADEPGTDFLTAFFIANGARNVADNDATLTDEINAQIQSLTVAIVGPSDSERLDYDLAALEGTNIRTEGYDPATGILLFTGSATPVNYQDVLRTITYFNSSPNPNRDLPRRVTCTARDATGFGNAATATVYLLLSSPTDTIAPRARADVRTGPVSGTAPYEFTVTYIDDRAIRVSTLDSTDVRVTGPNGYDELATYIGVDLNGDGTPRQATYRINAPGGTWDEVDAGIYFVRQEADEVLDTSGNAAPAEQLGVFGFSAEVGDVVAPRARASASDVTTPGGTSYTIPVTFLDDVAILASTIDTSTS